MFAVSWAGEGFSPRRSFWGFQGIDMSMKFARSTAVAAGTVSVASFVASAGGVTSWALPMDGEWNTGANWSTGLVPMSGDSVELGLMGMYTAFVNGNNEVASVGVVNPDATLGIRNSRILTVNGDLFNSGDVIINIEASTSGTSLNFGADAILSGLGRVVLNSFSTRALLTTDIDVELTQAAGHTIEGIGTVRALLINDGTVSANIGGADLILNTNDKTNNSLMEAVNGGILDMDNMVVDQGAGGVIEAVGSGSRVEMSGITLGGGEVRSSLDGVIGLDGTNIFTGVDFTGGTLNLQNSRTLNVFDSIFNDGLIVVNSQASTSATQIDFENTGAFNGSGTVVLNSFGTRARLQTSNGSVMTNAADHLIRGLGTIEADLVNDGVVRSDIKNSTIFFNTNQKVNNSLIEAIGGAEIEFSAIMLGNALGQVVADGDGSVVRFIGTNIDGGELSAPNGGLIEVDNATMTGVDFSAGTMNVLNARTLEIFDSIINDGEIVVNSQGSTSATQILFANSGSFLGEGSVRLNSFATRARLQTGVGAVMTIPSTQMVHGLGTIEADLVNNGLVRADAGTIFLNTNQKVNNSTFEAVGGSLFDVSSITIDQTGGGEIVVDGPGSSVGLNGTILLGGDLFATNDATVDVNNATMEGVNFEGLMNVLNARTLVVRDSITNNGTIVVNSQGSTSTTQILFENSGSFLGSGEVVLNSFGTRARLQTGLGAVMTLPADHTILGFGTIEADLVNDGLIQSDFVNQLIFFSVNNKQNNALIEAINGSGLDFSSITMTQGPAGIVSADGEDSGITLRGTTFVGGAISSSNGGRVGVDNATFDGVDFSGELDIFNARTLEILNGTTNNGTIFVNSQGSTSTTNLTWGSEFSLEGDGTVVLNSFATRSRLLAGSGVLMAELGSGQRLEGIGSIDVALLHHGTTAPGTTAAGMSAATMFASQPVVYSDSSVFEAGVNISTSDLLDSSSTIELDGSLEVSLIDGFVPDGFWSRKIMEGSQITGKFDSASFPPAPKGFVNRVYNSGTEVLIGATCKSDQNLDGQLNFFDVSQFLAAYGEQDPEADINDDGNFNFFDVSAFLADFGANCPF
jgi:hypothetical protein